MSTSNSAALFCARCGHRLVLAWHAADNRKRLTCESCGSHHYDSPKVLVWCLAYFGETMLLCRRAIEPAKGLWSAPGGFMEAGETLEGAIARELREEAGIEAPPTAFNLYRVASLPHMNQIYVGFHVEFAQQPQIVPGPETDDAAFFSESTCPVNELAFNDMLPEPASEVFKRMRNRDFSVRCLTLLDPSK